MLEIRVEFQLLYIFKYSFWIVFGATMYMRKGGQRNSKVLVWLQQITIKPHKSQPPSSTINNYHRQKPLLLLFTITPLECKQPLLARLFACLFACTRSFVRRHARHYWMHINLATKRMSSCTFTHSLQIISNIRSIEQLYVLHRVFSLAIRNSRKVESSRLLCLSLQVIGLPLFPQTNKPM